MLKSACRPDGHHRPSRSRKVNEGMTVGRRELVAKLVLHRDLLERDVAVEGGGKLNERVARVVTLMFVARVRHCTCMS